MITSAKSRLAQAIAQSVSIDGRTVDRNRLAEAIGVAGPDDPLVVMLEAVSLAIEARAAVADVIAERTALLEQRLETHAVILDGALRRHLQELEMAQTEIDARIHATEQNHGQLVAEISDCTAAVAVKQADLKKIGERIADSATLVEERMGVLTGRIVFAVFAGGFVLGVGVCFAATRMCGH